MSSVTGELADATIAAEHVRPSQIRRTIKKADRLRALRSTGLLDSPPEECFDRLTRLAAQSVRAPAAFISLIDEHGDFYKSLFGFTEPLLTTRRMTGETFCHYTLVADGVLAIEDARCSPVFRDVPTVQSLNIIAYLGIPLVSPSGHTLGAFCVVDHHPREWTPTDIATVLVLARATMREIAARIAGRPVTATAGEIVPTSRLDGLSSRETEVLKRMLVGQYQKQIAAELGLSVKTVATHRARMLKKLQLRDDHDLFRFAVRNRLVDWL